MSDIRETQFAGQPSWEFKSDRVSVTMTQHGGMTAPVQFHHDDQTIQPYYVNPWWDETRDLDVPVLGPLRGDFFCLPFGADNKVGDEDHTVHGESASSLWHARGVRREGDTLEARFSIDYQATGGSVEKCIRLSDTYPAMFVEHVVSGFNGPYPLGHHATLAGGPEDDTLAISVKPFDFGLTADSPQPPYLAGEYVSLQPDQRFTSIDSVETIWRDQPDTSLARFPNRRGFVDIATLYRSISDSAPESERVSWTCAVNTSDSWLWFSLKDAAQLPATILWMENNGRHQDPWLGRNSCLGLEEVCAYSANGRMDSVAENKVTRAGIPTAVNLSGDRPTSVRAIQGAVPVPAGFDTVKTMELGEKTVTFVASSGKHVSVPLAWRFLFEGTL